MGAIFYVTAVCLLACAIGDHLTHTAFYQRKDNTMQPDHFDVFDDDEHGSTSDYWEAYQAALESHGFAILTDTELAALDESVDDWAGFDSPEERDAFLDGLFGPGPVDYDALYEGTPDLD